MKNPERYLRPEVEKLWYEICSAQSTITLSFPTEGDAKHTQILLYSFRKAYSTLLGEDDFLNSMNSWTIKNPHQDDGEQFLLKLTKKTSNNLKYSILEKK